MRRTTSIMSVLLLCACTIPDVESTQGPLLEPEPGQFVVILSETDSAQELSDCVSRTLDSTMRQRSTLAVMPPEDFRRELFPWFEPGTRPRTPEAFAARLEYPLVRNKIRALGLRYLITVSEGVDFKRSEGGENALVCGAGGGGAGCLGIAYGNVSSTLSATIWDLQKGDIPGRIESTAWGRSYLLGIILPIPIVAPTGSAACDALADSLAKSLTGASPGG